MDFEINTFKVRYYLDSKCVLNEYNAEIIRFMRINRCYKKSDKQLYTTNGIKMLKTP